MHACVFVFVYNSLLLVCSLALLVRLLSSFFILSHFAVEYIYCRKEAEEKKSDSNKISAHAAGSTQHTAVVYAQLSLYEDRWLYVLLVCVCVYVECGYFFIAVLFCFVYSVYRVVAFHLKPFISLLVCLDCLLLLFSLLLFAIRCGSVLLS